MDGIAHGVGSGLIGGVDQGKRPSSPWTASVFLQWWGVGVDRLDEEPEALEMALDALLRQLRRCAGRRMKLQSELWASNNSRPACFSHSLACSLPPAADAIDHRPGGSVPLGDDPGVALVEPIGVIPALPPTGGGWQSCRASPRLRVSRRVARPTPWRGVWRKISARNWGPSNHQWPKSSASKGAASSGRRSMEPLRSSSC